MTNNINNSKLSLKQMEEFLPDYVFERISEDDKFNFEQCLPNYPEIQNEIIEVRAVFQKMEMMDIEKPIRDKSRNLSVKVNQKLAKNKEYGYKGSFNLKILMPLMAMLVASAMFLYNGKSDNQISNAVQKPDIKILSNNDIIAISNDIDESQLINESANILHKSNPNDYSDLIDYEDEITELENTAILNIANKDNKSLKKYLSKYNFSDPSLLKDLNDLNEEEFQLLYKALKNEDINS